MITPPIEVPCSDEAPSYAAGDLEESQLVRAADSGSRVVLQHGPYPGEAAQQAPVEPDHRQHESRGRRHVRVSDQLQAEEPPRALSAHSQW